MTDHGDIKRSVLTVLQMGPHGAGEIATLAGLKVAQVRNALIYLRRIGVVGATPVVYFIHGMNDEPTCRCGIPRDRG